MNEMSDTSAPATINGYTRLLKAYGALTQVPVYKNHRRGNNWCAKIGIDPRKPGGLSREFFEVAKGAYYYIVPDGLSAGDALEFGADYVSGTGHKTRNRWYGVVVDCIGLNDHESALVIKEFSTGTLAAQGAALAVTQYAAWVINRLAACPKCGSEECGAGYDKCSLPG